MEKTSRRLRQAMADQNVKQSELVEMTGISKGALSSYISGSYVPKQTNIYLLAEALGVSEAWLMGYDVPRERSFPTAQAALGAIKLRESSGFLRYKEIMLCLEKLNDDGLSKAMSYVKDLLDVPRYLI